MRLDQPLLLRLFFGLTTPGVAVFRIRHVTELVAAVTTAIEARMATP
jgi:hypothetical protein